MANQKATPLLSAELHPTKQVMLANLVQQPGWRVVEEIFEAACRRAVENVISVNELSEDYERTLAVLHSKARERNEFSALVLKSIDWHVQAIAAATAPPESPSENPITKEPKQ
jgi:hypothetical protein